MRYEQYDLKHCKTHLAVLSPNKECRSYEPLDRRARQKDTDADYLGTRTSE